MKRYAILTQESDWCIEEVNIGDGYGNYCVLRGQIYEEIEAETRGQARKLFTDVFCDNEFTTPIWIKQMFTVACWGCGLEWFSHKPFPNWDYNPSNKHALWCGGCKLPWIETGHQDRELSNCKLTDNESVLLIK